MKRIIVCALGRDLMLTSLWMKWNENEKIRNKFMQMWNEIGCSPTLRALASPKHAISIKIHCCCSSLSYRRFICWTHVYDFNRVDSQFRIFIFFWAIKIMIHKISLRTAKVFRKCAPSNVVQLEKGKKQRILWLNSNAAQFMQWKLSLTLSD